MENNIWISLVDLALKKFNTPFYLFSSAHIEHQLNKIYQICDFPVQNCLSIKTLPLKQLLKWWFKKGLFAEVTSGYELLAALEEGFRPRNIVVNGVSKHTWDKNCWVDELRVNFDSLTEIIELADLAKKKKWHLGIRFHPFVQNDPENPSFPDQFGISTNDFKKAVELIKSKGLKIDAIHIHLRSNIPNLETFLHAIDELHENIKLANINLKSIDLGGGLPASNVMQKDPSLNSNFKLEDVNELLSYIQKKITSIDEIILENGRFILSSCGVLVFSITDIKNINGFNFIICDGGRTNNALPSDWEEHLIEVYPFRTGRLINFSLCGPTCMAYDCISRINLPENTQIGDKIIYYDAGAYHLSWENRFSHPLSTILWHDDKNNNIFEVRKKETFYEWWENKR